MDSLSRWERAGVRACGEFSFYFWEPALAGESSFLKSYEVGSEIENNKLATENSVKRTLRGRGQLFVNETSFCYFVGDFSSGVNQPWSLLKELPGIIYR